MAAHHLLLHLVLLAFTLQFSHIQCREGPAILNQAGDQGQGLRAVDVPKPYGTFMSEDVTRVSNLRAILQSVASLLELIPGLASAGDKNRDHLQVQSISNSDNQVEVEAPEKVFNTAGAKFVYNAEFYQDREQENVDDDSAEKPHLLMPFQIGCKTGNYIDDCWRCDPNWQNQRQVLASCAIGFGQQAEGGKSGKLYVVTSNKDDAENPAPGTLRYGVTRREPLWIIFSRNMTIKLEGELVMASYKTIDGRGADVHLVGKSQITIEGVSNVIVHGIHIHDIVASGPRRILTANLGHVLRAGSEGDAIHIKGSSDVWIDHCFLAKATDGLIDGTKNSTRVTVSNCYFENHDKVMLFGASPKDDYDRNMQITIAFNRFGPGLTQRMPRCRYGNCHVANNFYTHGWGLYAIGGSEDPTFLSQGNRFIAPSPSNRKEVTERIDDDGPTFGGWQKWDWTSNGDSFANGAFFVGSGVQNSSLPAYDRARSFVARHASWVPAMTEDAGPLKCVPQTAC